MTISASKQLKGVTVALITPFASDGSLASEKVLPLLERLIATGVHGFYVGGSTGEAFLMSVEERCEFMQLVARATKGQVTLIAQVGALAARDAWAMAEHAAQYGYDVISSTPPFYYAYTEEEIIAYYRELARRSPVPVLLYNAPHTTGRKLSLQALGEVMTLPNVIGAKHTDSNLFIAERLIRSVPGTQLINGPDEMFMAGLAMGMVGGIGTTYNLMPRLFLDIYKHVSDGELGRARESQAVVNEVIDELLRVSPSVIPGVKLGLKMLGFDVGPAREPFLPIRGDTSRFERLLRECGGLAC